MDMIYGYPVAPGHCFVCGNSDPGKPVMDMGLPPGMGSHRMHIYLCSNCLLGAAMKVAPLLDRELVTAEALDVLIARANEADAWEARATEVEDVLSRMNALAKEPT